MKKIILGLAITAIAASQQTSEKANIGIFAETRLSRIAGMKPVSIPKLPFGMKLPSGAASLVSGTPTRGLTVKLWSPNSAPDDASASLAIPTGLELGDKLDLDIYRPKPITPPTPNEPTAPTGNSSPQQPPDFTIKIYWGSSDTVKDGQPKIFSLANLNPEAQSMLMNRMSQARKAGQSLIYKPTGSTAFWPGSKSAPDIKKDASLVGSYSLSGYAGSASMDVPSGVDFLDPIEITSPSLDQKIPMDGPVSFQWNAIPNCLGLFATAFGIQDKNTMILWTSSEEYGERIAGDMGYLGMDEVKGMVDHHTFLPGDSTSVTIPGGIFKDCAFSAFNMIGYGPGAASGTTEPSVRIQTKTSLNVVLLGAGGKGAQNRGDNNR